MNNTLKILITLFILTTSVSAGTVSNRYKAAETINGTAYRTALKEWINIDFIVYVGIDNEGDEYIFFHLSKPIFPVTVNQPYDLDKVKNLKIAIQKAIKWVDVAKKNKADTVKVLGCFGNGADEECKLSGEALKRSQLALKFHSWDNGKVAKLSLSFVDETTNFKTEEINLDIPNMKLFISALNEIEKSMEKARSAKKNEILFD